MIAIGAEGEPADAKCPKEAPVAISGGGSTDGKGGVLETSAPITDIDLSDAGEQPTGWRVVSAKGKYTSYAICSTGGKESGEGSESEVPEKK